MPTRDFTITTEAVPAGTEITFDRATSGWEVTCSWCGAVMARDEPETPAAAGQTNDEVQAEDTARFAAQVRNDRFAVKAGIIAAFASSGAIRAELELECCKACAPGVLSPFLPFLSEQLGALIRRDVDEPEPGAVADEPEPGAVADAVSRDQEPVHHDVHHGAEDERAATGEVVTAATF